MAQTLSIEYLFDAARSRPDLYLPLLQERFEVLKDELLDSKSTVSYLQISLYTTQDRLRKLQEAVETITIVANKIIEGATNGL